MSRCIGPISLVRDGRRQDVPCGRCNFCLQAKRADWTIRLSNELRHSISGVFLTLTYDEAFVPYDDLDGFRRPTVVKRHCQLFIKRLRKYNEKYQGIFYRPVRYYMVAEYGTRTARPHYHGLFFNLDNHTVSSLNSVWGYGGVHVGQVTPASIHYVTKYAINASGEWKGYTRPFALMSTKPGIGYDYLKTHRSWHRNTEDLTSMRYFTQVNGVINRLPRYYKDRLFTSIEKTVLSRQAIEGSDQVYVEEIERLARLHPYPDSYFDERERHAHDKVVSKVNVLNTF